MLDVTLAILAGGKGSRMGSLDKGLVHFRGKPLIERQLRLTHVFPFHEVLVVLAPQSNARAYESFGDRRISDVISDRGAPGAVHAAMIAAKTEWLFVVACDMPCIAAAAVERLLVERTHDPNVDAICFEVEGRLEPLLGLYRTRIGPEWRTRLEESRSFRALLSDSSLRLLPEQALKAVDPSLRSVQSVNTTRDLERLETEC